MIGGKVLILFETSLIKSNLKQKFLFLEKNEPL